ncbi:MAG: hydantoinase/oxoprolinase family protein [Acidimicrobiales bacterium]
MSDVSGLGVDWACSIAVDVGGTFTDIVVSDDSGALHVAKSPSVPSDPSRGVLDAVTLAADRLGIDATELLAGCKRFVHGSTVATNAVLEGNLAKVGLITTAGFRDALEIRRGLREDQWDHRAPWPAVLVPRDLRIGVGGRVDKAGEELEQLDIAQVEAALDRFEGGDVEAVAICLLHSYCNDRHERTVAEMARTRWPGALTTASHELVPLMGEYERTSTSVVNAALVPKVGGYLQRLADRLTAMGLRVPLLLIQSNGGTVPVEAAARRPVDLVLSGPAAVGGALDRAARGIGSGAAVSIEIGGTSCDVAVRVEGSIPVVDGLQIGGYHLNIPAVDVHTVGAGGGTIATVDAAGLLRMGPQGAGADPGPACYGRGGIAPTATDAHLLLGRLRPGPYAGGSIELDADLAHQAITAGVAQPLGTSAEVAAQGMLTLLEQHIKHAVEVLTIERGRDPRSMTLVAAGGAGGLHAVAVARALGCARVVVPAEAGVFCAIGMLHTDLRRDSSRTLTGSLDTLGAEGIAAALLAQQAQAEDLASTEWGHDVERACDWFVDLRYPGQLWSLRVAVGADSSTADIRRSFETEYDRLYGHIQPQGVLEVTSIAVVVHGFTAAPVGEPEPSSPSAAPRPAGFRRCWVDASTGWADLAVYEGHELVPGVSLDGPLIVEATTTTVLVGQGDRLNVMAGSDLEIVLR